MSLTKKAYIAACRFGMGVNPGEVSALNQNPKKWVIDQLKTNAPQSKYLSGFATAKELIIKADQISRSGNGARRAELRKEYRRLYSEEIKARTLHSINSKFPVQERLTYFWSNHFAVSVRKPNFFHLAVSFEREAIRPNILGKFSDLLLAVVKHPSMLVYLDNIRSVGPNSPNGLYRRNGLNENLAREILELHTMGVNGGYAQKDVVALAKLITGWSVANKGQKHGEFKFFMNSHEPGRIKLLGKSYVGKTDSRGIDALLDIAKHPSTAKFVTHKLIKHFHPGKKISQYDKVKISDLFLRTEGDLKQVYKAIFSLKSVWSEEEFRIKNNQDYIISLGKLFNIAQNTNLRYYLNSYKFLGNEPFYANSPEGYSDDDEIIASSEVIKRRIELIIGLISKVKFKDSPTILAKKILGDFLGNKTKDAIMNADNEQQAYSFLLASPEFHKR